jgi:hypothetical protein
MPLNITNSLTIGKYAKKAADPFIWVAVANTIIATVSTPIIIRSTNGKDWEAVASNGGLTVGSWDVAYNNGLWIATAQGGSLITRSTDDGKTWSSTGTKGGILGTTSVAYGKDNNNNGLWVACGEGSRIVSSPDGNNWTAATWVAPMTEASFSAVRDVAYGNGLWVAAGYSNPSIAKSTDGKNWSGVTAFTGNTGMAVAYGNGVWVVIFAGSIIVRSTDGGATWSAVPVGSLGGFKGGACVAYGEDGAGNGRWVAGGLGYTTGPKIIFSSDNGASWSAAADAAGIIAGHSVAYGQDGAGNKRWVIVGEGGSKIAYSSNGSEWTAAASNGGVTGTNSNVKGVAFKN